MWMRDATRTPILEPNLVSNLCALLAWLHCSAPTCSSAFSTQADKEKPKGLLLLFSADELDADHMSWLKLTEIRESLGWKPIDVKYFHFKNLASASDWCASSLSDGDDANLREYHMYLWSLIRGLLELGPQNKSAFINLLSAASAKVPELEAHLQYFDWSKLSGASAFPDAFTFFSRRDPTWWPKFMGCQDNDNVDERHLPMPAQPDHGVKLLPMPTHAPAQTISGSSPVAFLHQLDPDESASDPPVGWKVALAIRDTDHVEELWRLLHTPPDPKDMIPFQLTISVNLDNGSESNSNSIIRNVTLPVVTLKTDWKAILKDLKSLLEADDAIKALELDEADESSQHAEEEWLEAREKDAPPTDGRPLEIASEVRGTYTASGSTEVVPPEVDVGPSVFDQQAYHAEKLLRIALATVMPEVYSRSTTADNGELDFDDETFIWLKAEAAKRFSDGVRSMVLIPKFQTLKTQTEERMNSKFRELIDWGCCEENMSVVMYQHNPAGELDEDGNLLHPDAISPKSSCGEKYHKFLNDVRADTEGKTLFILIADECHTAINAPESGAKGSPAHHFFVNNPDILLRPNVVVLDISATPFNLITRDSRIHPQNRVVWGPTPHDTVSALYRYVGLNDYLRDIGRDSAFPGKHHIREDSYFVSFCKFAKNSGRGAVDVSKGNHDDLLAVDYAVSLAINEAQHDQKDLTQADACGELLKTIQAIFDKAKKDPDLEQLTKAWALYKVHVRAIIEWKDDHEYKGDFETKAVKDEKRPGFWKELKAKEYTADYIDDGFDSYFARLCEYKLSERERVDEMAEMWANANTTDDEEVFREWKRSTFWWTETDRVVDAFTNQKKSYVVRTSSGGKAPGLRFYQLLRIVRDHFGGLRLSTAVPRYEVCPDFSNNELTPQLNPVFKKRVMARLKAKAAHAVPPRPFDEEKAKIAFEDIDFPCLLVLVEKGRMGDTFNEELFGGMDMRLRNHAKSTSKLSTLIQEIGRLAGWRKRLIRLPNEDPDSAARLTEPRLPVALVGHTLYKCLIEAVDIGLELQCLQRLVTELKEKGAWPDDLPSGNCELHTLSLGDATMTHHGQPQQAFEFKRCDESPDAFERMTKNEKFVYSDDYWVDVANEQNKSSINVIYITSINFENLRRDVEELDAKAVLWEHLVNCPVDKFVKGIKHRDRKTRELLFETMESTVDSYEHARGSGDQKLVVSSKGGRPVYDWCASVTAMADPARMLDLDTIAVLGFKDQVVRRETFGGREGKAVGKHLFDPTGPEPDAKAWALAMNGMPVKVEVVEDAHDESESHVDFDLSECNGRLVIDIAGGELRVRVAVSTPMQAKHVSIRMPLWVDPRRVLLQGLPQIGKTGTYYYTVMLLRLACAPDLAIPPPDPGPIIVAAQRPPYADAPTGVVLRMHQMPSSHHSPRLSPPKLCFRLRIVVNSR